MAAVAAACVVAVGTVAAVTLATPHRQQGHAIPAAAPQTVTVAPPTTRPRSVTPPSSTTPPPASEASAQASLEREMEADRAEAEILVEMWVPQLSSKKPGLVADGVTYDYRSVWTDFLRIRQTYPDALLLWSGDYSGFRYPDFWIVVKPLPYSTGPSANAWCEAQGIPRDGCYAKRLTHTGSYADSTLLRK